MSTDKNNKTEELKEARDRLGRVAGALDNWGLMTALGKGYDFDAHPTMNSAKVAFAEDLRLLLAQPQPSRDREELREQIARTIETVYWPLVDEGGRNTSNEYWGKRVDESLAKADAILSLTGVGGGSPLTAEQVFTAFREHVAPTLAPWGDQEPETRARYEAAARALRDSLTCPTTKS